MNLFQLGNFTLSSGAESKWKLECDALNGDDWRAVAEMVRRLVGPFFSVEGVPSGGLKLAEALRPFVSLSGPHLIVDDVLTTGGSMERMKDAVIASWKDESGKPKQQFRGIAGAVLFARGQCPHWVKAVFQMPEFFWVKVKKE